MQPATTVKRRLTPRLPRAEQTSYSYETRVNACGEYLVGKLKVADIAVKYGIKQPSLITYWIRQRRCFKVRVTKIHGQKSQEAQAGTLPSTRDRTPVERRAYHKARTTAHLTPAET